MVPPPLIMQRSRKFAQKFTHQSFHNTCYCMYVLGSHFRGVTLVQLCSFRMHCCCCCCCSSSWIISCCCWRWWWWWWMLLLLLLLKDEDWRWWVWWWWWWWLVVMMQSSCRCLVLVVHFPSFTFLFLVLPPTSHWLTTPLCPTKLPVMWDSTETMIRFLSVFALTSCLHGTQYGAWRLSGLVNF